MYLNRLSKQQRRAFLELAHFVAREDSRFCEDKQQVISQFCVEMKMDDIVFSHLTFNLDKTLDEFVNKSHQKLVIFELTQVLYACGIEKNKGDCALNNIVNYFGLNPSILTAYKEWRRIMISVENQGKALLQI